MSCVVILLVSLALATWGAVCLAWASGEGPSVVPLPRTSAILPPA